MVTILLSVFLLLEADCYEEKQRISYFVVVSVLRLEGLVFGVACRLLLLFERFYLKETVSLFFRRSLIAFTTFALVLES